MKDLLTVATEGVIKGYIAVESIENVCVLADVDTTQPEVSEICSRLKECDMAEQIQLSSADTSEKSELFFDDIRSKVVAQFCLSSALILLFL